MLDLPPFQNFCNCHRHNNLNLSCSLDKCLQLFLLVRHYRTIVQFDSQLLEYRHNHHQDIHLWGKTNMSVQLFDNFDNYYHKVLRYFQNSQHILFTYTTLIKSREFRCIIFSTIVWHIII
eukprot:UN28326